MGVLFALTAVGCTASATDVEPPRDQLFFPTGIAVAPDESVVFVANSNSELRYDSGTIDVIDLAQVQGVIDAWRTDRNPGTCAPDPDHRETLICEEAPLIRAGAGVRTGNFATDISIQRFGDNKFRLFSPNRGDPSIAWADYDGTALRCSDDTDSSFHQCDDKHRLTSVLEDPDMTNVADEPFGVYAYADPADPMTGVSQGYAVVSHQTNGVVTLIDSPSDGAAVIADIKYNVFSPDLLTGLRGASGVAGRHTDAGDLIYVGSRTDPRVAEFTISRSPGSEPALLYSNYFYLNGVGTDPGVGGSADTRGLTFSPDGNELYLVNRQPPSLQVFDTAADATGTIPNKLTAAADICRNGSNVASVDLGPVLGTRAFITCFEDGTVYVIDPSGVTNLDDVVQSGRGPFSISAAPGRGLVFVTNFLEDTISVIDVNPASANRNRVVLRIGTPKPPENN
ncbi:MAG TPA: hypothetical protein VGC42_07845 [Kofleriaceae bacterium]